MKSKITFLFLLFILIGLTVGISACKKDKEEEESLENNFNRAEMLSNIGDNLIVPAYNSFKLSVNDLQIAADVFIADPTSTTLSQLQSNFTDTYLKYQQVSAFEFGPAENINFRANFNIFPCDTIAVNTKIINGDLNFDSAADIATKGLPALDYLLHGSSQSNAWVLNYFTTNIYADNAKAYLNAIVLRLKASIDAVENEWNPNGGNYITTFKNNTSADVGGSVSMLVNQLNYDLEILKNAKIGIPLGKMTLGTPQPTKVEALYSAQSLVLVAENLENLENIYLGRSALNTDGIGLDDYVATTGATYGSVSLNDAIKAKFNAAQDKISLIPENLSTAVIENYSEVDEAYLEIQQLVILLKVDLPSAIGVSITYVDNDGD